MAAPAVVRATPFDTGMSDDLPALLHHKPIGIERKDAAVKVRQCASNCGRPAAVGYAHCCRTCRDEKGAKHGPICEASHAAIAAAKKAEEERLAAEAAKKAEEERLAAEAAKTAEEEE